MGEVWGTSSSSGPVSSQLFPCKHANLGPGAELNHLCRGIGTEGALFLWNLTVLLHFQPKEDLHRVEKPLSSAPHSHHPLQSFGLPNSTGTP